MAERGEPKHMAQSATSSVTGTSSVSNVPPHSGSLVGSASNSIRHTLFAGLGYLVIVAGLFHRLFLGDVLSPSANLWADVPFSSELREDLSPYLNGVEGDVWREFEPWHYYQYRAAREGRFPLWNPHIFCGFPLHANAQAAMLSPFHWIYFVIEPKWAAGPVAMAKLWVAGFGAFCLGRRLKLMPIAAFISGVAWMLCAFNVRWLLWNHSTSTAWLPIVLITLDRLLERMTPRSIALAGLAATALQLGGHPESQFHVGVLAGLYVVVRLALSPEPISKRLVRLGVCLFVQVVGVLGAAVAIVPFVERAQESIDWQGAIHQLGHQLPVDRLLGAVAPDHFGRPRAGRWYNGALYYTEVGCYIGLMPLALAAAGLVGSLARPRQVLAEGPGRVTVIFAVMFLFCILVVLGVPGVHDLVNRLPLFSKADNLRLILGVQFAGAMLAGVGWSLLAERRDSLTRRTLIVASWGTALLIAALLVWPIQIGGYSHLEGLRSLYVDPSVPAPREHRSLRTLVSFLFSIGVVVWACLCSRWVKNGGLPQRHLANALLVLWTIADLAWVAYDFSPVVPARAVFPDPPQLLQQIKNHAADGRIVGTDEILGPNLSMQYGLRDLRGYDYPIDSRLAELFRRLEWQLGFTYIPRSHMVPCVRPAVQSICDKASVRFLYTIRDPKTGTTLESLGLCPSASASSDDVNDRSPSAWELVARGTGTAADAVYRNTTAYPRAYFARRVELATPETALDALLDVSVDLRQLSFVEQSVELEDELVAGEHAADQNEVSIEQDGAEEVVLRTRGLAAGLLVLGDRYERNWKAEIDGQAAQPIRVNYLFRGVVVPAGEHSVRWTYEPKSVRWGCGISLLTVLLLCGILFVGRWDQRP